MGLIAERYTTKQDYIFCRDTRLQTILIANENFVLLVAHLLTLLLHDPHRIGLNEVRNRTCLHYSIYLDRLQMDIDRIAISLSHRLRIHATRVDQLRRNCRHENVVKDASIILYTHDHHRIWYIQVRYLHIYVSAVSALILIVNTPLIINDHQLITSWTCWGDIASSMVWSLIYPTVFIAFTTAIVIIASYIMSPNQSQSDNVNDTSSIRFGIIICIFIPFSIFAELRYGHCR